MDRDIHDEFLYSMVRKVQAKYKRKHLIRRREFVREVGCSFKKAEKAIRMADRMIGKFSETSIDMDEVYDSIIDSVMKL